MKNFVTRSVYFWLRSFFSEVFLFFFFFVFTANTSLVPTRCLLFREFIPKAFWCAKNRYIVCNSYRDDYFGATIFGPRGKCSADDAP